MAWRSSCWCDHRPQATLPRACGHIAPKTIPFRIAQRKPQGANFIFVCAGEFRQLCGHTFPAKISSACVPHASSPPRNRFRSRSVSVSSETGSRKCWHSVLIHCDAAEDGSLTVKVTACHFDWDEYRQIAGTTGVSCADYQLPRKTCQLESSHHL